MVPLQEGVDFTEEEVEALLSLPDEELEIPEQ